MGSSAAASSTSRSCGRRASRPPPRTRGRRATGRNHRPPGTAGREGDTAAEGLDDRLLVLPVETVQRCRSNRSGTHTFWRALGSGEHVLHIAGSDSATAVTVTVRASTSSTKRTRTRSTSGVVVVCSEFSRRIRSAPARPALRTGRSFLVSGKSLRPVLGRPPRTRISPKYRGSDSSRQVACRGYRPYASFALRA